MTLWVSKDSSWNTEFKNVVIVKNGVKDGNFVRVQEKGAKGHQIRQFCKYRKTKNGTVILRHDLFTPISACFGDFYYK